MEICYRYRILFFTLAIWVGAILGQNLTQRIFGTSTPLYLEVGSSSGVFAARIVITLGACLALVGALLRIWGSSYLRQSSVWSLHPHAAYLVTDGPFAWVRNPLYIGNYLIVLGFFPAQTPLAMIGGILGLGLAQHQAVLFEECTLQRELKQNYQNYTQRVHRWWPQMPQTITRGNASLGFGLLSEVYTAGIVLSLLLWGLLPAHLSYLSRLTLGSGIALQLIINGVLGSKFIADGDHTPRYP